MLRNCKDCKRTCCDDMKLSLHEGCKSINPEGVKKGNWIYAAGVYWVKKVNGLWRCAALNVKTRLCRIYKYRPMLCRAWTCKYGIKKSVKLPVNKGGAYDANYKITFSAKKGEL
ncbi:hypothetical protein LCGC14_0849290 [marine sediment metagenome]|uniref:YkgJ family cysteine cluster protein n=1 Tax=marine sediment metagenome TaxID=412755 RepID=A0A0F9RVL5_9ZZZZ